MIGIREKIVDVLRDKQTQIPTLPVIVNNILTVASSERTSTKDLADIIGKDQAISHKALKLANSSYYGLATEVDSIPRAIAVIGFNEIINVTIGMSVFSTLRQSSSPDILDMQDLCIHAIGCASAAKEIAKKTDLEISEQIFLAGLLHDIGKTIFAVYFPKEYRTALEGAKESQISLFRKERETLGLDHAELSGLLMERWNFPDNIRLPSSFHHNSTACPIEYMHQAMVIELANSACQMAGVGYSGDPVIASVVKTSQELGITPMVMEEIVKWLKEQRSEIEEFFKLIN